MRTRVSAHWESWADTLPMVQSRHPQIADIMVYHLEGVTESLCLSAAAELDELDDLVVPRWSELAAELRPPFRKPGPGLPGMASSTKQQFVWNGGTATTHCSPG